MQDFSEEPTDEMHRTLGGNLGVSRRGFMRATAAAGGAAAVGVGAPQMAPRLAPVDRADGAIPVLVGAAAAGYLIAEGVQYLTGSDVEREDLDNYVGADARLDFAYKTALQMQDADENTYTFLQNRISDGWKNAAWVDIKLAIVEELNAGGTEQAVEDAALAKLDEKASIPEKNFFNHWNKQIVRFDDIFQSFQEHSDIDVTAPEGAFKNRESLSNAAISTDYKAFAFPHTRFDGTEMDVYGFTHSNTTDYTSAQVQPTSITGSDNGSVFYAVENSAGDVVNLFQTTYGNSAGSLTDAPRVAFWENLQTAYTEMEQDVTTFVTEIYPKVQSGEISTDELVGVSEFESIVSEGSGPTRAYGELAALGISVNFDGGGTVRLEDDNLEVDGYLAVNGDWTATVGTTYDPNASDTAVPGDVYLALDAGTMTGTLLEAEYTGSLDGGVFELLEEPTDYYGYTVRTNQDENAQVTYEDFEENADGNYQVDLSDQLETPIAEVTEVQVYATDADAFPNAIQIDQPFTVVDYEAGGESVSEVGFQSRNTQTTSTDVQDLKDELAALRDAVDDWEDFQAQQNSDGGSGWLDFGGEGGAVGILAIAAAAIGAILLGNNN